MTGREGGVRSRLSRVGRAVFGDRLGLAVFLTALAVYAGYWRIGILLTDSYTVANALVAVSDGHLHVERAVYGPGLDSPGMGTRDGLAYGRNYGQVFLALPFLLAVEALAAVAELRVALAAVWALLLLALALVVGRELDRPDCGAVAGSALAVLAFAGVVAGATPIEPDRHHLIALQLQTMVAASLVGVVCYRLLSRIHGRGAGVAAGLAATLVSPVGFWAQFPKRHVLVALCVLASMYLLYRSREEGGVDARFRAAAYVPVGVLAWISAFEGVVLLVALLAVDVPTGGRSVRSLAYAGAACVASLLPMAATNALVTGNPAEPPRALSYRGGSGDLAERGSETSIRSGTTTNGGGSRSGSSGDSEGSGAGSAGGSGTESGGSGTESGGSGTESGGSGTESGGSGAESGGSGAETGGADGGTSSGDTVDGGGAGEEVADTLLGGVDLLLELVDAGTEGLTEVGRLFRVFVRGGYIRDVAAHDAGEAIRLSFLEAMPLAAALVAIPFFAARTDVRGLLESTAAGRRLSPARTVDAFAVVYALLVTVVYLPRLPIHTSITVRFLLPVFPLAIYGLVRLPAIRRVLAERAHVVVAAYVAGVFVGGQALVVYLWLIDATRGEAVQAHALLGLVAGACVFAWAVADCAGRRRDRFGAVALGLSAAAGTVFLVLAALWYFSFVGPRALPLG